MYIFHLIHCIYCNIHFYINIYFSDLIKQYNGKTKEIDKLKSDLEIAKKEIKHITCSYKSAMNTSKKLEMVCNAE